MKPCWEHPYAGSMELCDSCSNQVQRDDERLGCKYKEEN